MAYLLSSRLSACLTGCPTHPRPGSPLTHQGRVVVEKLNVEGPIEDVQTLKQVKGYLVQMAISAMPPTMVSRRHHMHCLCSQSSLDIWGGTHQIVIVQRLTPARSW